jgi:hypothetical protein
VEKPVPWWQRPPILIHDNIVPVAGFAPVYAADFALGNGASRHTNGIAPGGNHIGNMHNHGAWFEGRNMDGGITGGNGFLRLVYAGGELLSRVTVVVNGTRFENIPLGFTGGWTTFMAVDIPVTGIHPGNTNIVRIIGGESGFDSAYIQLYTSVPLTLKEILDNRITDAQKILQDNPLMPVVLHEQLETVVNNAKAVSDNTSALHEQINEALISMNTMMFILEAAIKLRHFPGDINGDGIVNVNDLNIVLNNFGASVDD